MMSLMSLVSETVEYMDRFEIVQGSFLVLNPYFEGFSIVVFLISLYLLSKFMKNRDPMKLKTFSVIHNFFCSCLAFVTMLGLLYGVSRIGKNPSQTPENLNLCTSPGFRLEGALYFWCFIYHAQKYYELVDTYLIVLRKSQKGLTFLHVFHHSIMLALTNTAFIAKFGGVWVTAVANSFVHTVMYFYYGLTVLQIRWKKNYYITYMQIVQFLIILANFFLVILPGRFFFNTCSGNLPMVTVFHGVMVFFLCMFSSLLKEFLRKRSVLIKPCVHSGANDEDKASVSFHRPAVIIEGEVTGACH